MTETEHPHFTCAKCRAAHFFNSVLALGLLLAIPFVDPTRAVALALVMVALGFESRLVR